MSVRVPLANRADLLRWIEAGGEPSLSVSASFLSYRKQQVKQKKGDNAQPPILGQTLHHNYRNPTDYDPSPQQQAEGESRPAEEFYYLASRTASTQQGDDDPDGHLPEWLRESEALTEAELYSANAEQPLGWQPLVPDNRLSPFLRHALSEWQARRLDVRKLVKQVAELHPLYRLPKVSHQLPAGRVCILVDCNQRVRPFWRDFHALCSAISRKHGRLGLDIRQIEDETDPCAAYSDWFDEDATALPWVMPAANSVMLILSDVGLLAPTDTAEYREPARQLWKRCGRLFAQRGIRPVVLAPVAAVHLRADMQALFHIVPWDRGKRLQEQRPSYDPQRAQVCQRLLSLLACAVHVELELLRAIARLLPAQQADTGLEAEIWLHHDVVAGQQVCAIRPERRSYYQALFSQEAPALQESVLRLMHQHHSGQFRGVWMSEVIEAEPLVKFPLARIAATDVNEAIGFMQRVARTFHDAGMDTGMRQYAHAELERLPASLKTRHEYTSVLFAQANTAALRQGRTIPAEYDGNIVQALVQRRIALTGYTVLQRGEHLLLAGNDLVSSHALRSGSPLATVSVVRDTLQLLVNGQRQIVPVRDGQVLCRFPQPSANVVLDTGQEKLVFSPLTKPTWATAIGRDADGLFVECFWAGETYRAYWRRASGSVLEQWERLPFGEDNYGLYADLTIKSITQRFRWIEPGTFLMGSPPDEAEREPHESLKGAETQHQVTLTQGFWLADTTVTQALWQAVMGNNPSHFNGAVTIGDKSIYVDGANNPVEKVNWEDTQAFIAALNGMVADLGARLPTDAQWEYACRAGTSSVFSFGDNITPEQVNYDGNYPYANGKKGQDRQKTVPVKSLPANPWGLYEMHGNVWEWCQDWWQQEIPAEPVIDPEVLEAGVECVVRGGSWNRDGRGVRSAIRAGLDPARRYNYVGFRLAIGLELRSGQGGGAATPARADDGDAGRRVAGDTADRGSVGSGGFAKPADKVLYSKEMMEFMESVRPQGGLSVDDIDKPTLAERVAEGLKGLTNLFRKKK